MKPDKVTKKVLEAWIRFEETLETISPLTYATLQPGATDADLAECENELEFALPPPVRAFYSRHNGESPTDQAADGVFEFGYFLPLTGQDSAVEESLTWDEMLRYPNVVAPEMEGRKITMEMTKNWLTFAKDYSGNSLILDCNPGKHCGEVYFYDHEADPVLSFIAADVVEFLEMERQKIGSRSEPEGELDEGYEEDLEEDESELRAPRPRPRAVRRKIEERAWMEMTLRLPHVRAREEGKPIQTETMKEMDLVVEFVSPATVTRLAKRLHPDANLSPEHYVAVTIYPGSNPTQNFLDDSELPKGTLFRGEELLGSVEHGSLGIPLKGSTHLYTVFYWRLPDPPNEDVGLMIDLKRRKPD